MSHSKQHLPVRRAPWRALPLVLCSLLCSCASYPTPGRAADMSALGLSDEERARLTDASILEILERRPLANLPAALAVVRVQEPGYESWKYDGERSGRYSLINAREAERLEDFQRIAALPQMGQVSNLSSLFMPKKLESAMDLRQAAASIHADLLLVYTYDTTFRHTDHTELLTNLSLGLLGFLPTGEIDVTSRCDALLMDTRSGYIYGVADASAEAEKGTSGWVRADDCDAARQEAERKAFRGMVDQLEARWKAYMAANAALKPAGAVPGAAAAPARP